MRDRPMTTTANLPFEEWAPSEIKRLRDEANTLELALTQFLARTGKAQTINAASTKVETVSNVATPVITRTRIRSRSENKTYKFDVVEAALREAGEAGLTIGDMYDVIERNNVDMNRTTLRTMIWHKKGKTIPDVKEIAKGRYMWVGN